MTNPADDPNADLSAALRRELAGLAVPHDDGRADAMIRTATAADPLGARSWAAPLAAAAAVVVVGGGAAALAATHGGGGSPAGDGPAGCPAVSSSAPAAPSSAPPTSAATPTSAPAPPSLPVVTLSPDGDRPTLSLPTPPTASRTVTETLSAPALSSTPALSGTPALPSTPALSSTPALPPTPVASSSADPCDARSTQDPSVGYSLPPQSSGPAATTPPLPSAGVGTPGAPGIYVPPPPPSSAGVSVDLPVTVELTAAAGAERTAVVPLPPDGSRSELYVLQYRRLGGGRGTVRTEQDSRTVAVHDLADDRSVGYLTVSRSYQSRLVLSCTGTTTCRVQVTLSATVPVPVDSPAASSTPSR